MKPLFAGILLLVLSACSGDGAIVCQDSTEECAESSDSQQEGSDDSDQNESENPGDSGDTDDSDESDESDNSNDPGSSDTTAVTGLSARHQSGQTFLTWNEPDSNTYYHVYRSSQPISAENISSATLLTGKWGPLDPDTSVHKYAAEAVPGYFVIEDLGAPLDFDTGLFVHTTQAGQAGTSHYAVTSIVNGNENKTISSSNTAAVSESVNTPKPILTVSMNDGKGRIYTHYMDYTNWNPTLNGYAFNYTVAVPFDYSPSRSYSLRVELHAFGETYKTVEQSEFDWQVIQLFPSDPGSAQNSTHTWWYGHAADHNYLNGEIPTAGNVENFTEQRVIKAINEVVSNSNYNVDPELIHAYGHSMGASGSVSMAMHYPSVFAGIYASEPMTNYASSPTFQENFEKLWGTQSTNLSIVNQGPNSSDISRYSVDGSRPAKVWNWMNHHQQLRDRRSDNFAFMMMAFGKADTTIDWATQGQPMFQALTDGTAGFSASAIANAGHSWLGFTGIIKQQFGFGGDELGPWRYPNSLSFVALQYASDSGSLQPTTSGTDDYNTTIDWSTPQNSFGQNIVDSANRYEISLRSLTSNQTASVTPRNTKAFRPSPGQQCSWVATRNSDNSQIASGNITVDNDSLATAATVPVNNGSGTRLVISCS